LLSHQLLSRGLVHFAHVCYRVWSCDIWCTTRTKRSRSKGQRSRSENENV